MQGLAVGRIVHYVDFYGVHHAAIVTCVYAEDSDKVDLTVFSTTPNLSGITFEQGVTNDEQRAHETWHWPEKV